MGNFLLKRAQPLANQASTAFNQVHLHVVEGILKTYPQITRKVTAGSYQHRDPRWVAVVQQSRQDSIVPAKVLARADAIDLGLRPVERLLQVLGIEGKTVGEARAGLRKQ